jgi:hypothetical protein
MQIHKLFIFLLLSYVFVTTTMHNQESPTIDPKHKIEIAESDTLTSIWHKTATGIIQCMRTSYTSEKNKPKESIHCHIIHNGTLTPISSRNFWLLHMRLMQQNSQKKIN